MGIPSKLKNCNAYVDGGSYIGIVGEYEEPKLALMMEDWRGGGTLGTVPYDMGLEKLEATLTMGGHVAELVRKFGTPSVDGTRIRLVAAYQADNGSSPDAVNIFLGGRFSEIDMGKAKPGDNTEHKYKAALAYYRREVNGRVEMEIDMLAGVFIVDGVDRYAEIMSIITS